MGDSFGFCSRFSVDDALLVPRESFREVILWGRWRGDRFLRSVLSVLFEDGSVGRDGAANSILFLILR